MAQTSNKLFFILFFLAALVTVNQAVKNATPETNSVEQLSIKMKKLTNAKSFVNAINEAQNYWTASVNEHFALLDEEHIRRLLGGVKSANAKCKLEKNSEKMKTNREPKRPIPNRVKLPKEFDARKKWPECADFIGMVTDQGACNSCASVSAASVLTARFCIERLKKGIRTYTNYPSSYVSAQDTLESQNCNCADGASPTNIWQWYYTKGAVSGTNFTTGLGCKPYLINSSKPDESLFCKKECDGQSPFGYREGRIFNLSSQPTRWNGLEKNREADMMMEIYENGPIQVGVTANRALLYYGKSNGRINIYVDTLVNGTIYDRIFFKSHAFKLIGWGQETREDGEIVKYWLGVNSWGTDWGENGLFKWRRGTDESKIESEGVNFGTPFV